MVAKNPILEKRLPKIIDKIQAKQRGKMVSTACLVRLVAECAGVTDQVVRRKLTEAVADGRLLEILVRRDWLIVWPEPNFLPPLYVAVDGSVQTKRPFSSGSNGVSFLMSPMAYRMFIERQYAELKSCELA